MIRLRVAWTGKNRASVHAADKRTIGEGVFRNCDACASTLRSEEFSEAYEVCPSCGHHYALSAENWTALLLDEGSFVEHDADLISLDPLGFNDAKPYTERAAVARKKTGINDAMLTGFGKVSSRPVEFGSFVFRFMGGSMGSVVGEKITRMFERGTEHKRPVILLSASGGARMQEGILSLMQMAKTVSALGRLREAGMPFISVLLNPTTGGVAASFSLLGDINIAEPGALIGFAGARVIENTIRQTLPEGFQRAEFLLEHGMIDLIEERARMKQTIAQLLGHLMD